MKIGNVKDFELEAAQKKVEELQRALDQVCLEKEKLDKNSVSLEKYQLLVSAVETLTKDNVKVRYAFIWSRCHFINSYNHFRWKRI